MCNEEMVVDLTALNIDGIESADLQLGGMLTTGEKAVEKESTSLVLPEYSVAILK